MSASMRLVTARPIEALVDEYLLSLAGKAPGTVDAYGRILRQLTAWIAARLGSGGHFQPEHFTRTALETYLADLASGGYSVSHRMRVKAVAGGFARWLIEEKGLLRRNPARGVDVPAQAMLAPRQLSPDQRYVLRTLIERADDPRGPAVFALGYWAGCRVSDVAWLRVEHAHIGPKIGWLHVGYKGGKAHDIEQRVTTEECVWPFGVDNLPEEAGGSSRSSIRTGSARWARGRYILTEIYPKAQQTSP